MVDPAPSRIDGQWVFFLPDFVDGITKTEQGAKGKPREGSVRGTRDDVTIRHILIRDGEAIGCQEFFDREMRELNDGNTVDGDQTGTGRRHCSLRVLRLPVYAIIRNLVCVKSKGKHLCKLFNTKGANGDNKTLQEPAREFLFFLINAM